MKTINSLQLVLKILLWFVIIVMGFLSVVITIATIKNLLTLAGANLISGYILGWIWYKLNNVINNLDI